MAKVTFDEDKCKGCGLCLAVCPKQVIATSRQVNARGYRPATAERAEACIGCVGCALICPDGAIAIYKEDESQ